MQEDAIRYSRGTVWMRRSQLDDIHHKFYNNSVQSPDRPVLILSNNAGNISNETVIIVPITSQEKPDISVNVKFNSNQKYNTVLCNQIQTVSTSELKYYMFTVSDFIVDKVEKAVSYSLDFKSSLEKFDKTSDHIKTLVESTAELAVNDILNRDEANDFAVSVARGLEDLYLNLLQKHLYNIDNCKHRLEEAAPIIDSVANSKTIKLSNSDDESQINIQQDISTKSNKPERSKNSKWTTDLALQYIFEFKNPSFNQKDIIERFGISNAKGAYQKYYDLIRKLKKLGIDDPISEANKRFSNHIQKI